MAKNYRYEVVFRTVYLEENCDETGAETECILFRKISGNSACVDDNIQTQETHHNGKTHFAMVFTVPKEK